MTHCIRRCAAGFALVLLAGAQACRDSVGEVRPSAAPSPRSIVPRIVATPDGASFLVVTIALDVGSEVGPLGSFTGRLRYDSLTLAYEGEAAIGDGTARASNREGGVVRVAGMSATGIDAARIASFRFRVLRPASPRGLQFDVEEMHELSRTNVTSFVRRPDAGRVP